jgi:hypothetical protein
MNFMRSFQIGETMLDTSIVSDRRVCCHTAIGVLAHYKRSNWMLPLLTLHGGNEDPDPQLVPGLFTLVTSFAGDLMTN